MKTLLFFYSYSGKTKELANQLATETNADLYEIKDVRKPSTLAAYTKGALRAMRQKTLPTQPIAVNLDAYDKILIMAPIWAGFPAPSINSVFDILPIGKEVSFFAVSASGKSKGKDAVLMALAQKGCTNISYTDMKAP